MTAQYTAFAMRTADDVIRDWSDDQRDVAERVIGKYGQPDEVTENRLIWNERGRWREMSVTRESWHHEFPFPHEDCLECVTEFHVPYDKISEIAEFDGSVHVMRTRGHVAATCHDEQANLLAINLAHDIARDATTAQQARQSYVEAMIDYRAKKPTPYMEELQFEQPPKSADPDAAQTTPEELQQMASKRR